MSTSNSDPEMLDSEDLDSKNSDREESYSEESDEDDTSYQKIKRKRSERPAEDLRTKIFSTLELLKASSAFAYSIVDPLLPNPILYVPPHGLLGLPLSPDDAKKIISQASQSPFGKGEETLIDTSVRKSWELNPNQFSFKNPAWNKVMEKILGTVTAGFGLEKGTEKVSAELNKLLLYEPGAFFKPHKDSEKAPGMFATLVVCLPSPHEGGKLVLTHDNEKYEFETADTSSFSLSYAAWYSDITHEVLPVTSGYRLMLTYNLIRQTGFEMPSYDLVCEHVKQLSTLLEQYNSRLVEKDDKLPPFLLHILKHKYTQANLKLDMLKPLDLGQVQTLTQLSKKLGFYIYLATLVLTVETDDEDTEYRERHQHVENIVEVDGEIVIKRLDYKDCSNALIDPKPQNEGKPYKEEHEGPTGNEGSPATYWYRDTVVVLVPPSKQIDFIFQFKSDGSVIDPLFCKLLQEFSKDQSKLEQLCERALKQNSREFYYRSSQPVRPYIQQSAIVALDLGRMDLFNKACEITKDKVILNNARLLGCWTAKRGLVTMAEQLMKGVRIATSVARKINFLKVVAEGFETAVPEPSSAEIANLKQWSDEAIFTAVAELEKLTKDDCLSLAQLCKTMDWSEFESKAKPIILKAVITTKITFTKELMSILQQELDEDQRSFIEVIIRDIWNDFFFNEKCLEFSSFYWRNNKAVYFNENDILHIVENSITILTSECVVTTIIPAMLTAIPTASEESAKKLFIPLVQMILKNKLPGFELKTNETAPPPLHKRLVQAFLTKFLLESVGNEPQPPANWSLPACHGRCSNCRDCSAVNRFLKDPRKESFIITCSNKTRLAHLDRIFTQSTFDVTTTLENNPRKPGKPVSTWRITKNRRAYEAAMSEWKKKIQTATQTLSVLKTSETVDGRLEAYLEPYYSIIINAIIKELPDLKSLITSPELSEPNENTAAALNQPRDETGHKRGASDIHPLDDELAKRTKS